MSVDAPLLWKRRIIAGKIETTTGTAIALSATDGVFNVYNPQLDMESTAGERAGQGASSPLAPIPGANSGTFTCSSELFGSGTSGTEPSWADTFLVSCGFAITTGVAKPKTGQSQTLTMGLYNDGRLKQIAGAQGDFSLKIVDGKAAMFNWKFMGKWVAPTSVALIAPTYPTTIPPVCMGITFTIGGTSYRVSEATISCNNEIEIRKDGTDASGYHAAIIKYRKITVDVDPEALLLSSQDWYAFRAGQTSAALAISIGSVSGNIIGIAAPVMYLLPPPKDKNSNDTLRDELKFLCCRNSAAGDDELSFTF